MGTEPWNAKLSVKEGADYAASYISPDDAMAFCEKLSQRDGRKYRLPTEAEWEYGCRAGTTTRFHFGDSESRLGDYAWFDGNTQDADDKYAHRVGQKRPNPFGLYDMHGNVFEWCSDWFGDYSASSQVDPRGPSSGDRRVPRGGAWKDRPRFIRSASRHSDNPFDGSISGFRVVSE